MNKDSRNNANKSNELSLETNEDEDFFRLENLYRLQQYKFSPLGEMPHDQAYLLAEKKIEEAHQSKCYLAPDIGKKYA